MYRSFAPWQSDEERLQAGTQLPASVGLSGSGAAPAIGSAGAPPIQTGGGAPGALRAFFALNRDQGGRVLGDIAGGVNREIANTQAGLETVPTVGAPAIAPNASSIAGLRQSVTQVPGQITTPGDVNAYTQEQQAKADAAKQAAARNQAAASAVTQDWNRLGTQEGQQSLLEQQYGSAGYTPGQARLDAWLAGSAANANPNVIGNVGQNYSALQTQAAATPTQDPNALANWLRQQREQQFGPLRKNLGVTTR